MAVPQDQLVTLCDGVIALMQNFRQDLQTTNDLINQFTNLQAGTALEGLPTCAVNSDGSLGSPDATPDTGNVIDTRIVTKLTVALSSYDFNVIFGILQAFANLFDGQPVATQSAAPAMLAKTSQ